MTTERTIGVWTTQAMLEPKHAHRIKEAAFRDADNPLVQMSDLLIQKAPINTCIP